MPKRAPKKLGAEDLLQYALRSLSARAQSAGELRLKLIRRAERKDDVDHTISRLREQGFLDDRRYAGSIATSRLENQGTGKAKVLTELRRRRIAPGLAQKAVEEAYGGTDEVQLIEAWLRRKYRGVAFDEYLAEPKNLASAYRRLRGAGFTSANAVRVLKRFATEPELLDGLEDEGGEPAE